MWWGWMMVVPGCNWNSIALRMNKRCLHNTIGRNRDDDLKSAQRIFGVGIPRLKEFWWCKIIRCWIFVAVLIPPEIIKEYLIFDGVDMYGTFFFLILLNEGNNIKWQRTKFVITKDGRDEIGWTNIYRYVS